MTEQTEGELRENAVIALKHLAPVMESACIALSKFGKACDEAERKAMELRGALVILRQWIGEIDE